MAKLKPLSDKIVLERIETALTSQGGIVLPDTAKEKPEQGKVIAVGKDVKEVKVGDQVLFSKYGPTEVKVDGKEFLLVKEEEILAVIA